MARMERTVRKVVFPAAGLGTRFLPATKVVPKEMLVLVDKPVIQYGVEEALQSGVSDIAIVTSRGKSVMESSASDWIKELLASRSPRPRKSR